MASEATEKLVTDFKVLVSDTEELVKATAAQTGDKVAELRAKLQQSAASIEPRLAQAQNLLEERARTAAATTDIYVRSSPWVASAVAAGIGVVIGLLIGRK